jgi:type II secretory pathway component PulJ
MKRRNKTKYNSGEKGFTLAEAMATLAIATMIMAAVIGVYMGIKRTEAAMNKRLQSGYLAMEILQRIAEDIDGLALPGSDVTMSIKNRFDTGGYNVSQMVIENKIYDKDNKPQTFGKVIWQSRVDTDSNGLVLYRAHSGYMLEDKMLEEPKEKYERELFVPVCSGITFFTIEAVVDNNAIKTWSGQDFPPAVKISISFEPRQQDVLGNMIVPEDSIRTRTVAINRFRQIPYQFVYRDLIDPNKVYDMNDPNRPADANNASARRKKEVNEPLRK